MDNDAREATQNSTNYAFTEWRSRTNPAETESRQLKGMPYGNAIPQPDLEVSPSNVYIQGNDGQTIPFEKADPGDLSIDGEQNYLMQLFLDDEDEETRRKRLTNIRNPQPNREEPPR